MRAGPWCAIALLCCLAFSNTLNNGWHFDDHHSLLENEEIRRLDNVGAFFTEPSTFTAQPGHYNMYRPLLLVGYAVTYALAGYSLPLWHAVQILLHTLCALFVFALLRRLCGRGDVALIGASLFAVHPIQTHAVNYLSSRSEIQASLFYVVATLAAIRGRSSKSPLLLACSLAALTAALLTKSIAVTVPVVILLWDLWLGPGAREEAGVTKALRHVVPHLGIVVLYLILRKYLLGSVVYGELQSPTDIGLRFLRDHPIPVALHVGGGRSLVTNLLVQATVFWRYLFLFLWPPAQSVIHDVAPTTSLLVWPTVVAIPAFLILTVTLVALRRRHPLVSFCGLFFILVLAPTSIVPLTLVVNEHRVYLASAGLFLLVAHGLVTLSTRWRLRRGPLVPALVLLCLLVYGTRERNRYWRSSLTLFGDALRKAPNARFVRGEYGIALVEEGLLEEGLWELEVNTRLFKTWDLKHRASLAVLHAELGNFIVAERYIRQALTTYPDEPYFHLVLAFVLRGLGRSEASIEALDALLARHPDYQLARRLREEHVKNTGEERERLAKVLNSGETTARALELKGMLLIQSGRYGSAERNLRRAIASPGASQRGYDRLVVALGASGKTKEALEVARKAREKGLHLSLEARYFIKVPPYGDGPPGWSEVREVDY